VGAGHYVFGGLAMIRQKKGAFYILIGIVFLTVFLVLFVRSHGFSYQDRQEVVTTRVLAMNDFVISLNQDVDRAAYISGFRSLIGLEEYLSSQGSFFDNRSTLEEMFRIAFTNGTIDGVIPDVLDQSSFLNYLERVRVQARIIDINVSVNITNISLEQVDPWAVEVTYHGSFLVEDLRKSSWWEYEKEFRTLIPIFNLKDPLYTVNTQGRVPNVITSFSVPPVGFVGPNNDTTTIKVFMEESFYIASSSAPSYVQRFYNDLSAHPFGVESLVFLPQLSDQGIVVLSDRSVVDYLYFSSFPGNGSTDRCSIHNLTFSPDWFRIDADHVDVYNLSGLSYSSCP
jgi:hypothetical protein